MHALVAARLGDTELALSYLDRIARLDPDPNAAGGVRIAGLGGIWQAIVLGFGGLDISGDTLAINPKLPPRWRSLAYQACFRGRRVAIRVGDGKVTATLVEGEAMEIRLGRSAHVLSLNVPLEAAV
jgi:trehalose/maltose hydrolase-like predicted phosphorylase